MLLTKGHHGNPSGDGNILTLDCQCWQTVCGICTTAVQDAVMGNLVKGKQDIFEVFFTTAYEFITIS